MSKCSPQLQEALIKQFQNISAGARLQSIMLLFFKCMHYIYCIYIVYICLHNSTHGFSEHDSLFPIHYNVRNLLGCVMIGVFLLWLLNERITVERDSLVPSTCPPISPVAARDKRKRVFEVKIIISDRYCTS